jgi:hypothetical protein
MDRQLLVILQAEHAVQDRLDHVGRVGLSLEILTEIYSKTWFKWT